LACVRHLRRGICRRGIASSTAASVRRATGSILYILDEPTAGLHFDDVKKLLAGVWGGRRDAGCLPAA
jgi:hypothetical protein